MRRILWILLIAVIIVFGLYAFVDPVREWMRTNLGPPLSGVFGGAYTAIITSPLYLNYIAPPLNMFLIAFVVGIVCYHFLLRPTYTKFRGTMVQSAMKDSGMYPMQTVMKEPVSAVSTSKTPTPVSSTPQLQPEPKPEPAPSEASA